VAAKKNCASDISSAAQNLWHAIHFVLAGYLTHVILKAIENLNIKFPKLPQEKIHVILTIFLDNLFLWNNLQIHYLLS